MECTYVKVMKTSTADQPVKNVYGVPVVNLGYMRMKGMTSGYDVNDIIYYNKILYRISAISLEPLYTMFVTGRPLSAFPVIIPGDNNFNTVVKLVNINQLPAEIDNILRSFELLPDDYTINVGNIVIIEYQLYRRTIDGWDNIGTLKEENI